ncbi:MAG: 50S ribosomal protein L11 methyltransferase, partial [Gemmatimonadota bacterium]|nr:50S ribosomal protein L11 methyltransferase [Gemmatimonadota bacterium]
LGAGGVQEEGDALLTFLPEDTDLARVRDAVARAGGRAMLERTALGEVDWSGQWAPRVKAHRVGRVAIAPPWLAADVADAEHVVIVEPAMAFGTGEHPTTRGVVWLMQAVVRPGDAVADLGAGSAVLSIVAAKLGATRVFAIEMDGDAIGNAEENVRRNDVAERIRVLHGEASTLLQLVAPVRVILANIISTVLVELLPSMRGALAPDGCAIVSGILQEERAAFLEALARRRWASVADEGEGDWWSTAIVPR